MDVSNYRQLYGLQQWHKSILYGRQWKIWNNSIGKIYGLIYNKTLFISAYSKLIKQYLCLHIIEKAFTDKIVRSVIFYSLYRLHVLIGSTYAKGKHKFHWKTKILHDYKKENPWTWFYFNTSSKTRSCIYLFLKQRGYFARKKTYSHVRVMEMKSPERH